MAAWGAVATLVGLVGLGWFLTRKERQGVQTQQMGGRRALARLSAPSPTPPPASAQALTGEVVEVVKLSTTRKQPGAVSHEQISTEQNVAGWGTGFAGEGGSLAGIWGDK